jgi:lysophospholipase L1-like esterase
MAQTSHSPAGKPRRLWFKLTLAVLLTLLFAEVAVRVYEARTGKDLAVDLDAVFRQSESLYRPHPYIGFVPRPGAASKPGMLWTYEVNSLGFRGAEMDAEKPPRTFRVACLGGSTTWGVGATTTAGTWPAQLQRMLQERLPPGSPYDRVEAINAGTSGYTLMESFVNFKMRVAPLEPDLVVVYHAVNDARVIGIKGFKPDYTHVRSQYTVPLPTAWDVVFRWSHLYGLLRRQFGVGRSTIYDFAYKTAPEELPMSDRVEIGLPTFIRTLSELVAVARVNGAEVVLTTFAYAPEKPVSNNLQAWLRKFGFKLVDSVNAATAGVAERQGAMLVDLAGRIDGDASLFTDPVHLTDQGNRVIASELADAVVASGLLAGPRAPGPIRPIDTGR